MGKPIDEGSATAVLVLASMLVDREVSERMAVKAMKAAYKIMDRKAALAKPRNATRRKHGR